MFDDTLFDDPGRLIDLDSRGLLRAAALAGAQVRSAAEQGAELGLEEGLSRPRALVLLRRPGVSAGVCELLAALAGSAPIPIVVADEAPSWIGPLDVLFSATDDPADVALAESVHLATRRGASVVLAAHAEGPVAAAGAGRAHLFTPRLAVPEPLTFGHVFAVGILLFRALGLLFTDTNELADALDAEAERSHPRSEPLTNPATSLCLRLAEHTPLLWGMDAVSTAVAQHAAFALGVHAGLPADVSNYSQAVARQHLFRAAASVGSAEQLFADPGESPAASMRVLLINVGSDERSEAHAAAATAALPAADLVTPGESVQPDPVLRSALLATRFDLSGVYVGLAAGTLNGPEWPALAVH